MESEPLKSQSPAQIPRMEPSVPEAQVTDATVAAEQGQANEAEVPTEQFMVVTVQDRHYALPADCVQEIVLNEKVYALPFVPPYIEGLINSRGTLYTVLNPIALFERRPCALSGGQFLLVKRSDDRFCLHITNAETLVAVPETDARGKTILWQGKKIANIDCNTIEKTLQKDLEQ